MKQKALIVGAGFAGAVCAERLANSGWAVTLMERRGHIGGNAHDRLDEAGVLIHPYGPHIFHTQSKRIFAYLSQFTDWRFYEHKVLAFRDHKHFPMPINRTTLNLVFGLDLSDTEAESFLEEIRERRQTINTSEDLVLNSVGTRLCNLFYRGYTLKQWGLDLADLSPGVAARIPVRSSDDDRYFTDHWQFMPADGYTRLFERMLAADGIEILLGTEFSRESEMGKYDHIVYTGPIDTFYGYRFGRLPYRSIRFEHQHLSDVPQHQLVGTINYPDPQDGAFTRITEFKHLTGQIHPGTSIVREFPQDEGDPYYPIPRPCNEMLYKQYEMLARAEKGVTFVGRLAQYRYYNMDQVVGAALKAAECIIQGVA